MTLSLTLFSLLNTVSAQEAVVSSYYNSVSPTNTESDEWTELLVIQDNLDMRNWTLGDNNTVQMAWQQTIKFNNISFWAHMRAGTIILIWHRGKDFGGNNHPQDINQNDGYIELWANDANYFTGGDFDGNTTLNIAIAGDLVQLKDDGGNHVHALGHITTVPVGGSYNGISGPKLNHTAQLPQNSALIVLPGIDITYYGTLTPQSGVIYTSISSDPDVSLGLPNSNATWLLQNSNFWRITRQPNWTAPALAATPNGAFTQVNLTWNTCIDPYSSDGTQGYLILRNTTNSFTDPVDGTSYNTGAMVGSASVVENILSSATTSYSDNIAVTCGENLYYRIYPFRYSADNTYGTNFNVARGRAYNETNYAQATASGPAGPAAPTSASVNPPGIICADDAGNIILTANGGSGSNIEWFEGSCGGTPIGIANNLSIPSPILTTTYYVRWVSPGCIPSSCVSVTVNVTPAPTVADAGPDQSKCGVLTTILAGNLPLVGSGLWSFVSGPGIPVFGNASGYNSSVTVTVPGLYTLRWTISNGSVCLASEDEVTIDIGNAVNVIAGSNSPVCSGEDIQLTSSITGATYLWSGPNGFFSSDPNPVIANSSSANSGTYTINVSNIPGGCPGTSNSTIVIVNNTPVTPPISSQNVVGNEQDVCTGSQLPYSIDPPTAGSGYSWNLSGGGFIIYTGSPNLININWTTPGSYVLTVTETTIDGCVGTPVFLNIVVNSISAAGVSVSPDSNPACTGILITFTAYPVNGGTSPQFTWFVNGIQVANPGPPTFSYIPSDGDQVYVSLSSSSPCALPNPVLSEVITMAVNSTLVPAISISTVTNPACSGSTVVFTSTISSGGNNPVYQWKKNSLNVGTNSPTYSDNTLINNDLISCELTSDESCASPANATSNTVIMTITSILTPAISIAPDNNPLCTGSTVVFSSTIGNGGNMPVYQWKKNGLDVGSDSPVYSDNTFNNNDVITCILTSNAFCSSPPTVTSNPVTLTVNPVPSISGLTFTNPSLCAGTDGTIVLSGLIPATIYLVKYDFNGLPDTSSLISDGSGVLIISGLSAGNFSNITVTLDGCISLPQSVNLNDPGATAAPTIIPDIYSVCPGDTAILTATGCNGTITWSNGETGSSIEVSPTVTTTYTATCTFNGCTSVPGNPVEVTVKSPPQISSYTVINPTSFCINDGVITLYGLIPNTAYTAFYTFNGSNITISISSNPAGWLQITGCEPTTYFNIAVELDGCRSDSVNVVVGDPTSPQSPFISTLTDTICPGQTIILTALGCNGVVNWSDGSTGSTLTTTPLSNITYSATCTESFCTSPPGNPLTIIVQPIEIVSISGTSELCEKSSISLSAVGNAATYEWLLPNGTSNYEQNYTKDTISMIDGGLYKLVTTDNLGCTDVDSIEVIVNSLPEISISSEENLCAGTLNQLDAGQGFTSYLWQDGSTSTSYAASEEGEYWLRITDDNGCSGSDTVWLTYCPGEIFIPDAFSPNGDTKNDFFRPVIGGTALLDFTLIIFNRWGQKIFESNDYLTGWDGTINGIGASVGIYTYFIIYKLSDPAKPDSLKTSKLRGIVTLVK